MHVFVLREAKPLCAPATDFDILSHSLTQLLFSLTYQTTNKSFRSSASRQGRENLWKISHLCVFYLSFLKMRLNFQCATTTNFSLNHVLGKFHDSRDTRCRRVFFHLKVSANREVTFAKLNDAIF